MSGDSFFLELLNGWRLSKLGETLPVKAVKAKALLGILALSDETSISREGIVNLLWEGTPHDKARASLRQLIHALKPVLGDHDLLVQSREDISLNRQIICTDVDQLFWQIESGDFSPDGLHQIKSLSNLLVSFDFLGSEFSDWARDLRIRLQTRAIKLLRAHFYDQDNPLQSRNACAQLAHDLDPYDEEAVRALMDTHFRMNQSAAALRVYDAFFAVLEQELDAEPSPKTQELAVRIKLGEAVAVPALPATLPSITTSEATVAVLPFEVTGFDVPEHVVFGLLDHLTCQLAVLRAPAVISSNSTRRFYGHTPEPHEVRDLLDATYVVSGVIRTDGTEAVLSVQITKTSDNKVIWANRHRCLLQELYSVDLPIACEIVQAVSSPINSAELKRSMSIPPESLEPYHLFLRAKSHIFQLTDTDFAAAGKLLYDAIKIDPGFAPAHALLAEWFAIAIWQGFSKSPKKDEVSLEYHLQRAMHLSPGDGRVLALWAHSQVILHRCYDQASLAFEKALDLGPNDAETLFWSVPSYAFTGRADTAITNGENALRLSPLDPFAFRNEHFLSLAHYTAGNFARSAELGLSSFRRAPKYAANLRTTIAALAALGRESEAAPLVETHRCVEPDFTHDAYFRKSAWQSVQIRGQLRSHLLKAGLS